MNFLVKHPKTFTLIICTILFSGISTHRAQTTNKQQERIYIKIEIKGLACPYCAYGMEKKLKEVSGIHKVEIELKEGLAYISTLREEQPSKESLQNIIFNAGFTPGKIMFSNTPFIKKKTHKKI